jgi:hypothetical protein
MASTSSYLYDLMLRIGEKAAELLKLFFCVSLPWAWDEGRQTLLCLEYWLFWLALGGVSFAEFLSWLMPPSLEPRLKVCLLAAVG